MVSSRRILLASLALAGAFQPATAALEFKIDPTHSSVIFKVKNRGVSYVWGRFKKVSGIIKVDRFKRPRKIEIAAEVAAKSVDTNDSKRNRHLNTKEFLDSRKFTKISFTTKKTKKLEDNKFELTGELTLLGVTKELTVVFEITGSAEPEKFTYRLGGETSFTIKRSDFGMGNMIPSIADEVTIMVNLEGVTKVTPAG